MQERFKSSGDELVTAIYQAAAKIIPASRPLELLAEQTRSNKIFAAWFNLDRRQGAITASFNMEPNYIENYREFHAGENPFFTHTSHFQAEGLVWRGCDILDPEKLKATEFYKLFMTSQAMLNTAHLVIRVRGPDIFHIVLTRRPEAEDFEDAALETCKLFAMHARRALDISSAAEGWSALNRGFATAIDELSAGVAVVELPTTIRYVNGTFDALLIGRRDAAAGGQSSAYWSGRGPLVRRLPRPILDALAMRPVPKSLVIHSGVDEGKRPVFIDIQPYHSHGDFDGQTISGYVILCRSADTEIEVDESALKAAYFLTTAEARVAAALVAGENVMAVAARLGISPETVRTHIKHILEKTYTTRQAELMKLLMSVSLRKTTPTPTPSPERPDVIAELMKAIRRTPGAESST